MLHVSADSSQGYSVRMEIQRRRSDAPHADRQAHRIGAARSRNLPHEARYRYLSSTYIYAFVRGASETRFKERLGGPFHEGYLDRPERQWEMADCRLRPVIHEIGAGAKRALEQAGIVEESRTWLGAQAHRQFAHSLMVCEVLASIERRSDRQAGP
jgi:hypothetical protein